MKKKRYTVIKDTREQTGWWFPESSDCFGTEVEGLKTGDYTIKGAEHLFVVERKASTGEFSHNLTEKRFENEMDRLEAFEFPYLLLDFSMQDIFDFPENSGIPHYKHKYLKLGPKFIVSRLLDYQFKYRTKIILCGKNGESIAASLFKKMNERLGAINGT